LRTFDVGVSISDMQITITRRPIGEAPEWVRDAWIGLSLPTSQSAKKHWRGVGVLTGPTRALQLWWALLRGRTISVTGYLVDSKIAVDLLGEKNAAAAQWWRENTPELIASGRGFVFDADACEPLKA
jgi:hypothetical protein